MREIVLPPVPDPVECPRCHEFSFEYQFIDGVCNLCAGGRPLKGGLTRRDAVYKTRFGVDYREWMDKQGGVCAICKADVKLTLDWDKSCCGSYTSCGKCVRGFLCAKCKPVAELWDSDNWESALTYLTKNA